MPECILCNKKFPSKSKLIAHKNRKFLCNITKDIHIKSHVCNLCNIAFKYKSELERHEKTDSHIINITKNNISEEDDLKTSLEEQVKSATQLKQRLQQEYEERLKTEFTLKEYEIKTLLTEQVKSATQLNKLQQENELLKFDFEDNIQFETEVEQELKPISNEIITYKKLNKINLNDILTNYSKLLTINELLFIINYNINTSTTLYIDKFWNNIEEENWIYLDNEIINCLGYKEINKGKEELIKIIKSKFEIEEDYKILNEDEYKSLGGSNKSYILMNSDCFKNICMLVGTDKSKDIRQYYIEVEKIFKFYIKYTLEFKNYESEQSKLIKNRCINKNKLKNNSKLYAGTTKSKAKENVFKFGSTVNEKTRKSSYNTGNVEEEKFFYVGMYECYDAISLEKRIAKLLINFKIPNESEMYQLHFTALDSIIKEACKNDCNTINKINNFLNEEYDKYLNLEPIKF